MDTAEFGAIGISWELPSSLLHPEFPHTLQWVEFKQFESTSDKQPREIVESSEKTTKLIRIIYFTTTTSIFLLHIPVFRIKHLSLGWYVIHGIALLSIFLKQFDSKFPLQWWHVNLLPGKTLKHNQFN